MKILFCFKFFRKIHLFIYESDHLWSIIIYEASLSKFNSDLLFRFLNFSLENANIYNVKHFRKLKRCRIMSTIFRLTMMTSLMSIRNLLYRWNIEPIMQFYNITLVIVKLVLYYNENTNNFQKEICYAIICWIKVNLADNLCFALWQVGMCFAL